MQLVGKAVLGAAFYVAASTTAFAASKTFDLAPFTAIEISSGINAVVTVGGTQSVVADSPSQEELDRMLVEVRDGKLHAWIDWDLFDLLDFGDSERQVTITISVPALEAASADSGSDVQVTGISGENIRLNASSGADLTVMKASGGSFDLNSSSGSDLEVEGTCESAVVNASSGSDLNADRLICADVDVNASSGSSIEVHATTSLKANASSGGSITVFGKPADVDEEESSGGDVDFRD